MPKTAQTTALGIRPSSSEVKMMIEAAMSPTPTEVSSVGMAGASRDGAWLRGGRGSAPQGFSTPPYGQSTIILGPLVLPPSLSDSATWQRTTLPAVFWTPNLVLFVMTESFR